MAISLWFQCAVGRKGIYFHSIFLLFISSFGDVLSGEATDGQWYFVVYVHTICEVCLYSCMKCMFFFFFFFNTSLLTFVTIQLITASQSLSV